MQWKKIINLNLIVFKQTKKYQKILTLGTNLIFKAVKKLFSTMTSVQQVIVQELANLNGLNY